MPKYNDIRRFKSARNRNGLENKTLLIILSIIAILLLIFMIYNSGGLSSFINKIL